MKKANPNKHSNNGVATGISLGLIFGLLLDNLALGLLAGIAFGGLITIEKKWLLLRGGDNIKQIKPFLFPVIVLIFFDQIIKVFIGIFYGRSFNWW